MILNPLMPKDHYNGCTAPLKSKRCILHIYSTNTGTKYFKHGIYSPFFPLQNAVCFIILTYLVPVLFTFYIQGVLKLKKNNSSIKRLNISALHTVYSTWKSLNHVQQQLCLTGSPGEHQTCMRQAWQSLCHCVLQGSGNTRVKNAHLLCDAQYLLYIILFYPEWPKHIFSLDEMAL